MRIPTAGKNARAIRQFEDIDESIRRNLDSDQQTQLLRQFTETSDGHQLVNSLGADGTEDLLSLSVRQTDNTQLRQNLFRLHDDGVSADEIEQFVSNVDELEGTPGIHDTVKSTASYGGKSNFRGDAFETTVAARVS